jgi:hypothetical protein
LLTSSRGVKMREGELLKNDLCGRKLLSKLK